MRKHQKDHNRRSPGAWLCLVYFERIVLLVNGFNKDIDYLETNIVRNNNIIINASRIDVSDCFFRVLPRLI